MTPHEENVRRYHATLHRLCGLPALSATMMDIMNWDRFLLEMKPLEETPEGAFTLADLTAVLSLMAKQKREGVGWSMRPQKILQNPEGFRDLVLQCRSTLAVRKRYDARPPARPVHQHLANGTNRITDDPAPEPEETAAREAALNQLAEFRKTAGL